MCMSVYACVCVCVCVREREREREREETLRGSMCRVSRAEQRRFVGKLRMYSSTKEKHFFTCLSHRCCSINSVSYY